MGLGAEGKCMLEGDAAKEIEEMRERDFSWAAVLFFRSFWLISEANLLSSLGPTAAPLAPLSGGPVNNTEVWDASNRSLPPPAPRLLYQWIPALGPPPPCGRHGRAVIWF